MNTTFVPDEHPRGQVANPGQFREKPRADRVQEAADELRAQAVTEGPQEAQAPTVDPAERESTLAELAAIHDACVTATHLDVAHRGHGATKKELARSIQEIQAAKRVLSILEGDLDKALYDAMDEKQEVVDGVGSLERNYAISRTGWRNDELTRALLAGAERPEDKLAAMLECASPSWRMSRLRARGIDPDDFCESTRKKHVTIRGDAPMVVD